MPEATVPSAATEWITGMTVAIQGYQPGLDFLALPSTPDIDAFFNARTGVLELTGVADNVEYADALQHLTFETNAPQPKSLLLTPLRVLPG